MVEPATYELAWGRPAFALRIILPTSLRCLELKASARYMLQGPQKAIAEGGITSLRSLRILYHEKEVKRHHVWQGWQHWRVPPFVAIHDSWSMV